MGKGTEEEGRREWGREGGREGSDTKKNTEG